MDIVGADRRAVARSAAIVSAVPDEAWDRRTPCARWTLRQLVRHMTAHNNGFAAAADGADARPTAWREPAPDTDLRAAYRESADRVTAAFGGDGVLDRSFWLPEITTKRPFPARQAVSFHFLDYVTHTWDAAVTFGAAVSFDDDLADAAMEVARTEVPGGPARLRPNAAFGPEVPISPTAPVFDRLLAVLGRDPNWTIHNGE